MVFQLHLEFLVATSVDRVQATRCIWLVRCMVYHIVVLDFAFRP